MGNKCKVKINNEIYEYDEGTSYLDIAADFQKDYKYDIVLVKAGNRLRELHHVLEEDCELEMITVADDAGCRSYKRSMTMMMLKAFYDTLDRSKLRQVNVHFSLSSGYFCTLDADMELTEELLAKIENKMRELVEKEIPFRKISMKTSEAYKEFDNYGMFDKAKLFNYRRSSNANVYMLEHFCDYYYGYMVPNTSYLKYFKLYPYDNGFVLQMIEKDNPVEVPPFRPSANVYESLKESSKWGKELGAGNIGELNDVITSGGFQDLILVQEALQEAKIASIAKMIKEQKSKRFIMIAGPSSSGKTTFSRRLSIQLKAHGLNPHPISVDNYYVNRVDTPRDENGNYDFENISAIDLELFNRDMLNLLNGEKIELPVFNFVDGKREYHGDYIQLKENDILVIEGIHALNDKMSYSLPAESKFKIYISALMMVNLDEHNRIPTTDGRLIRRMVRDARTRGKGAAGTLEMWNSVRSGEDKYIFPYQDSADVTFNSSLIYELPVMKQYAEQLLLGIQKDSPQYPEANRLLKFLNYIVGMPENGVPANSILREFIGGGCFNI